MAIVDYAPKEFSDDWKSLSLSTVTAPKFSLAISLTSNSDDGVFSQDFVFARLAERRDEEFSTRATWNFYKAFDDRRPISLNDNWAALFEQFDEIFFDPFDPLIGNTDGVNSRNLKLVPLESLVTTSTPEIQHPKAVTLDESSQESLSPNHPNLVSPGNTARLDPVGANPIETDAV